jgi:hypothetical protein
MIAYEFYLHDPVKGYELVGILPERRKNSERVTQESIMRWGKNIFSNDFDTKDIFFIQVTIDEKTVRVFRPIPFTTTQKDV